MRRPPAATPKIKPRWHGPSGGLLRCDGRTPQGEGGIGMHLPRKTYSAFVERQAQSKPPRASGTRGGVVLKKHLRFRTPARCPPMVPSSMGAAAGRAVRSQCALFIGVSVSPILFKLSQHLFVAHALKQAQFSYRQCSPDAVSVTVVLAHPYR